MYGQERDEGKAHRREQTLEINQNFLKGEIIECLDMSNWMINLRKCFLQKLRIVILEGGLGL